MIPTHLRSIQALIIDMDGVLWKDNEPIGDLKKIFLRIRSIGLKFMLATNNSSRSPLQYQQKLESFDAVVALDEIVTSSVATAQLVKNHFPQGGPVYIIGETGLREAFVEQGFYHSDENVLAVIAGMDRQFTFEKLKRANHHIRMGASFFGTNPDRTFPTPDEISPGAGSIIAAIETASYTKPIMAGKPERFMLDFALSKMKVSADHALAIGDRLDTDILGGYRAGCKTALVLSGITTEEDLKSWDPKPDIVLPDLQSILGM